MIYTQKQHAEVKDSILKKQSYFLNSKYCDMMVKRKMMKAQKVFGNKDRFDDSESQLELLRNEETDLENPIEINTGKNSKKNGRKRLDNYLIGNTTSSSRNMKIDKSLVADLSDWQNQMVTSRRL